MIRRAARILFPIIIWGTFVALMAPRLSCLSIAGALGAKPAKSDDSFDDLARAANSAKAGQASEAIHLYRKALALNRQWAEGWEGLGVLLADREDYPAATEAFEKLTQLQPEQGDGWALLGLCEFRRERYPQAIRHLEKARLYKFANPGLQQLQDYHSALIMILQGDFDTAQKRLVLLHRRGIESEELIEASGLAMLRIAALPKREPPERKPMVMDVGQLGLRAMHLSVDQVKEQFQQLVTKYPDVPGLQYAYGNYLATQALYDEALKAYSDELRCSPNDALARLQMAEIHLRFNRAEQSLPLAVEGVQLAAHVFASHLILGKVLLKLGRVEEAISELETAAKQAPESAQVRSALLTAYVKANRKKDVEREKAIIKRLRDVETILMVDPNAALVDSKKSVGDTFPKQ